MTVKRDPEQVLTDWLAEGPSRLPDETRRAIASGISSTRQTRGLLGRGWAIDIRRLSMAVGTVALAVGFAVVILSAVYSQLGRGGVGSPPPVASPSPSASGLATFVSVRHGYSLQYPTDWRAVAATASWPSFRAAFWPPPQSAVNAVYDNAVYDTFTPPLGADFSRVLITSARLPAGMSLSEWQAAYVAGFPERDCIPPLDQWQSLNVDGVVMTRYVDNCGYVYALAISGGRAYLFAIESYSSASLSVFDLMLETVTFRPQDANDSPPPTPSPTSGSHLP